MSYEVQQALDEIMDMPPMFRRDYIIGFLRKFLPKDEAKKLYFEKDREKYVDRMVEGGYIIGKDLLDKIGKERVLQYYNKINKQS